MKIALITGASAGIGQATAIEIARQGIGVITTYRSHHAEVLADGGAIVKYRKHISPHQQGVCRLLGVRGAEGRNAHSHAQRRTAIARRKEQQDSRTYHRNNAGFENRSSP